MANGGKPMRKAARFAIVSTLVLLPGLLIAGESFDGTWKTRLACPAKGNTDGYTWEFPSVVSAGNLRGEHGSAGQPGYLRIEGKIAADGSAKLAASGIVASRKYGTGLLTHEGTEYSYDVKAQFKQSEGSGVRDKGLGIVGRPCTLEFTKQAATP
jgi:hypothetical protein